MTGIVAYGTSIPLFRIKTIEIARVWGKEGERIAAGLGIKEKSVASFDEDSCTLAVEAARQAMACAPIKGEDIQAIFVGSESKPYAVKPTAATVAECIFATPNTMAADYEFACKAGTAGIQTCMGLVASNMAKFGMAIGADTAQGKPNDALEFSAGSGAAAFVIGKQHVIAEILDTVSYTTDTPSFWRRQHSHYPMHAGRFTAEPAYFKHVKSATNALLEKTGEKLSDFDYFVFHQPNGKFPLKVAKELGVPKEKLLPGLITPLIGNTYSGSSMIGLASVLDVAKPGDKILVTSYGSGDGSDSFSIKVTEEIKKPGRRPKTSVMKSTEEKLYIDYALYVKHRRKIRQE